MNHNNIKYKDNIILVLNTLIDQETPHKQGNQLYISTLECLQDNNATKEDLFNIYKNYCGYLAYGEFSDNEYEKVKLIADYFDKISK